MKRIIYTAVALIFCASVFGIADYFNAKKQGALVNYTEEVEPAAVIPEKKTEIATSEKEEILIPDTKKTFKKQTRTEKKATREKVKDIHHTDIIPMAVTEKTKEPVAEKVDPVNIVLQSKTTDVNTDSAIQTSGKRKINMEMFSRAPIREKKIKSK